MEDNAGGIGCFVILVAGVAMIWLFWPVWPFESSDKITSYSAHCSVSYDKSGRCAGTEFFGNPQEYRVDIIRSEVISLWPTMKQLGPTKFTNCVIHDTENWECRYSDGIGHVRMVDGREIDKDASNWRYASEWEYRWDQIKNFADKF